MSEIGRVGGVDFKDGKSASAHVGKGAILAEALGAGLELDAQARAALGDGSVGADQLADNQGFWLHAALSASNAAGGVYQVQNDTGVDLLVIDAIIAITQASTTAGTALDVGPGAGGVVHDTLMDGILVDALGIHRLVDPASHGVNGGYQAKWGAGLKLDISKSAGDVTTGPMQGTCSFYVIATS
jgi:hypothetical protein